jgi:AcrR family transcriptional regulator
MKEKPFADIQITELSARAEVSRAAFYLHFRSKEELLLRHVDVIFDEFHAEVSREMARGTPGGVDRRRLSLLVFQYWERYAETLRLVIQAGNPDILLERLKAYLAVMLKELAAKTRQPARDPRLQELIVGYVAGGAYMLLTTWVTQKLPFTAEQMATLFDALTAPCDTFQMAR